jgi:hypothetical protein
MSALCLVGCLRRMHVSGSQQQQQTSRACGVHQSAGSKETHWSCRFLTPLLMLQQWAMACATWRTFPRCGFFLEQCGVCVVGMAALGVHPVVLHPTLVSPGLGAPGLTEP